MIFTINKGNLVLTIIHYCADNTSIRLTGPPVFFTKEIFNVLDGFYNKKELWSKEIIRLAWKGLSNLSMNVSVLDTIWQDKYLEIMYK